MLLASACAEEPEALSAALTTHCVDCHNDDTTEGEFSLVSLLDQKADAETVARFLQRVRSRVSAGEMPPEDSNTLTAQERRGLVELVDGELDSLADQLRDDPGEVAMARLTPYEYRNVIRDLSGGVVANGGRLLPNEGGAGEGFSNVGTAQVMTLPQYEKYVDAAKDALRHLRVNPIKESGSPGGRPSPEVSMAWKPFPRQSVDAPAAARQEVVDEIIAWHVAQQQKWGAEHRDDLEQRLGFVHAAYLEAAWRYAHREDQNASIDLFAWVPVEESDGDRIGLAPAALAKWWTILNSDDADSVHTAWAAAWRKLAGREDLSNVELRERCVAIVAGTDEIVVETEDFGPPYEISFHEAREEVLQAAEEEGHWPFRIDIGDAQELFLIVTDAGDGNLGEYAVWRRGRFIFRDGNSKPWQEAVTIVGANSGNEYLFGLDGEKSNVLGEDAVGAKPPGALKFTVPEDAIVFEVDLTLDENRTQLASIQALVLKEKPRSQSYVPGRYVFGGKKRPVTAGAKLKQEQERALRKRNVAEANRTKIGLNAERNVFAKWDRTAVEAIGGPWPDQDADRHEPRFPYHYTVDEVLRNATSGDLADLDRLARRLASLVDRRDEEVLRTQAEEIVRPLTRRAWRRDVTPAEVSLLMQFYDGSRGQGLSFDSAVKSSLTMVLASPHFIYKQLPTDSGSTSGARPGTAPLTSHALATRLAFFLWGSLPDDELLELAAQDELRRAEVLREQARRMLRDRRARSLAIDFAGQLWGYSDFESFNNPDSQRFPEFTPTLRRAMVTEVKTFLADIFQSHRPLTDILVADYSFVNGVLAELYGVTLERSVSGAEYVRVSLPPERGGLATMGLFLTKTSLPLRTSPVQRGVWLMESLLGRHLPNPPANVPSLSEDETNDAGENIREQLERHRADSSCASCHDKIDPLGISLENFDPIGRWRETERDGALLATVATKHEGMRLDGSAGLKTYLAAHRDEFIEHFNRKLLGYALGRAVNIGDRDLLARMRERLKSEEYRFSVLIDEIVASPQFRTRRIDRE